MPIKLGAEAGENILRHLLERYIFGTISHVPIIMFFCCFCELLYFNSSGVHYGAVHKQDETMWLIT